MRKFTHPYKVRLYVRDLKGRAAIFFKGVNSKKTSLNSNFLIDLKSVFGKRQ